MKKKFPALFLTILSFLAVATLGGCLLPIIPTCNSQPDPPDEERVIRWAKSCGVTLPESTTLLSYYIDTGLDKGYEHIYILYCHDYEGELTSQLRSSKFEGIVENFKSKCEKYKKYFSKEYTMPEVTENYFWLDGKDINDVNKPHFNFLYLPEANQILFELYTT